MADTLKQRVIELAGANDIDPVGFAPVERFEKTGEEIKKRGEE